MTDLALNDRLSQRSFSGVNGGFDAVDFQERPKGFSVLQQLPGGTHRLGPRRSLAALAVQTHCALQRGLKRLADRAATLLQLRPLDCSVLPLVPLLKQLLLQGQQLQTDLTAGGESRIRCAQHS